MRVKIGPYRSDMIPIYSLERKYESWRSPETFFLPEENYTKFDKFVFGLLDKLDNLVRPINRWSQNRKRKVKVHIDNYDVWSANHTLAMIIAPTLKQLRDQQHGYPHVDSEDVPEDLHLNENMTQDKIDDLYYLRWDYVLSEMIWTFEQYADGDDYDQFHHNVDQLEPVFTPLEDNPKLSTFSFNHQKDPSKPAYWVDEEGKKKHNERKKNGLRLFGKYYESLWD